MKQQSTEEKTIKFNPRLNIISSGLIADGYRIGSIDMAITIQNETQFNQVLSMLDNSTCLNLIIRSDTPTEKKPKIYNYKGGL